MKALHSRLALNVTGGLVALGLIAILGFVTWALVFRQIPDGNESVLNALVGILSANVGLVVGFFFGSSMATKQQTETIDTLASTAATAQAALAPLNPAPDVVLAPGQTATVASEPKPEQD